MPHVVGETLLLVIQAAEVVGISGVQKIFDSLETSGNSLLLGVSEWVSQRKLESCKLLI